MFANRLQSSARWYVYELIDPRDGSIFYVGKGTGRRVEHHEAEARKSPHSKKAKRIAAIWAAGLEVVRNKVAFFWCEQAAYDAETDYIEAIGLQNLTNVLPGGQTAWERRRKDRDARKERKPMDPVETVIAMADYVGAWLLHTNVGRIKAKPVISTGDSRYDKFLNELGEIAWTKVIPLLWERAMEQVESRQRVFDAFKPYGLELVGVKQP